MADIPEELRKELEAVGWDGEWIDFYLGQSRVCLDGHFTKRELEVIVKYMEANR